MALPFLGKLLDTVVDKAGGIIQELVPDKDLATRLEGELRAQLSRQDHEIQRIELQTERDMYEAQQETIQAELHQSDLFTKRTRPMLARRSMYLAFGYTVVFELAALFNRGAGAHWEIIGLFASPCLAYMGVRGWEKIKAGGSQ